MNRTAAAARDTLPPETGRWWWAVLIALPAYFLAAKVGLLLSLPIGFVSPLWPAAGVAFLLVLRLGYSCLPGVVLASLLSNLTAGSEGAAVLDWPDFGAPMLPLISLGLGAGAQAGLGVWLTRRILHGTPAGALRIRPLLRLLFEAGPLACTLNAGVAMLVLPSLADLPWADRLPVALVWWVGDALGVLGLMPLALFLLKPADAGAQRLPRWAATPALVAVAVVLLSWLMTVNLGRLQTNAIKQGEKAQLTRLQHALQSRFDRSALMLESFRAFYEASEEVSAIEFERYARTWLSADEAVTTIAWVPRIAAADRAAYEASAPGFGAALEIREGGPHNQLVAAEPRAEYWPLTLMSPVLHERVRGFDLGSESVRRDALKRALDRDSVVASGRLQLASELGGAQVSVLLLRRIHGRETAVLSAAIRLNQLVEHEIHVFDGTLPVDSRLKLIDASGSVLLDHRLDADGSLSQASAPLRSSSFRAALPITVADEQWQLQVTLPPQHAKLLGDVSWWLGQVMPQLFATVLGLALVTGTLRQDHSQQLQDDLGQLVTHQTLGGTMRPPPSAKQDAALAAAWSQQLWAPRFEPIIDLDSGLLRAIDCQPAWPEAPPGMGSAALFDWAERSGNDAALSRRMLGLMLAESRGWPLRRNEAFSVSLSVSPQALVTPGWVQAVLDELLTQRFPPRRLCLDICEEQFAVASAPALEALRQLRAAGVRIGLRGFGNGRGALSVLRRLPVDRIRLDRSLVRDSARDDTTREIVRTLLQLAGTLDIEVIGDGVDDLVTCLTLRSLGCRMALGQLFPPLADAEAVAHALVSVRPLWQPPSPRVY